MANVLYIYEVSKYARTCKSVVMKYFFLMNDFKYLPIRDESKRFSSIPLQSVISSYR